MYLQLTTVCNMRCPHCCYNCGPKGVHMENWTFIAFIQKLLDNMVTIGGGEPTMHPRFQEYTQRLLEAGTSVTIITNGSRKRNMEWLIGEIDSDRWGGNLDVHLSDPYDGLHNPKLVSSDVYNYFKRRGGLWGSRDHRYQKGVTGQGRALRKDAKYKIEMLQGYVVNDNEDGKRCVCPTTLVRPNGDIAICGCPDAPIVGNVNFTNARDIEICDYCHKQMIEVEDLTKNPLIPVLEEVS